jgi:hypothetical protein
MRRAASRVDMNALSNQRASSSLLLRERDPPPRQRRLDPAEDVPPDSARPPVSSSAVRRLFTPGLQREGTSNASAKPELPTIESQRSLHIEDDYEPSPTPAPRSRQSDGNGNTSTSKLPPLSIPAPLPVLPSESRADQRVFPSITDKSTNRRKISIASTTTLRGGTSVNPGLNITTPSAAPTTAVTPHTVSPTLPPLLISRTESNQSSSSGASSNRHSTTVTFSRPPTVSVSALSGLQQRDARNRIASNDAPTPTTPLSATSPWTPQSAQSGSETERPPPRLTLGRRTLGPKSHLSLDASLSKGTQTLSRSAAAARERRRTITEIFS